MKEILDDNFDSVDDEKIHNDWIEWIKDALNLRDEICQNTLTDEKRCSR